MSLKEKLSHYNKRVSWTGTLVGLLVTGIISVTAFIILTGLEYSFWFTSSVRTFLFYSLLVVIIGLLLWKVLFPLLTFLGYIGRKEDEDIAKELSTKLPELKDELINYLQLEKQSENELAKASLSQKSSHLINVDFIKAINLAPSKRFGKIMALVSLVTISLAFINPPMFKDGTKRLVLYSKDFVRPAPFDFLILNDSLKGFAKKDFSLRIKLDGQNIPNEAYLVTENAKIQLDQINAGVFGYEFRNLDREVDFRIEASGYQSKIHKLELINKPVLNLMSIDLTFPGYTGRKNETVTNSGNLTIPEGTRVAWNLQTNHSKKVDFLFPNDVLNATRLDEVKFKMERKITENSDYSIQLRNDYAINEALLTYRISTIADEFPSIDVTYLPDTAYFKYVVVTGEIEDDYGFRNLQLIQEINGVKHSKKIDFSPTAKNQKFYIEWYADSLNLRSEDNLSLYVEVVDNDAINGNKTSKSKSFTFVKPSLSEISDIIDKKSESAEKQMDKSLTELEQLQEKLKELNDRLKSNKETGWQEEKLIQESIEQRQEIEKMLEELKEKHDDLLKANQNFEQSDKLKEKSEQLNELIKDLMDNETQKLYEELKQLLEEKSNQKQLQDKLNQINRQENRMMKDLERTKELFKRLKMETGLEQVSQRLDSLASQQMKLSEETQDSSALQKQENIEKAFEEITEDLDKVEKLNQELEKPEPLEDFQSDEKQIEKKLEEAKEEMKSGEQKKSKKSQQNAAQQMKQMSKKMQQMQAGMEMEAMQENIEQLRKILDDLIKLSFKQEDVLGNFRDVNSSDPRFIKLSQDQLKLQEDLVVIEDSLLALANRVVQLSSFITKEVEEIDYHMSGAVEQIRERQRGQALSHQQFSMTSMNNLALLLNDVLQNMQMTMSEASGKGSSQQQNQMPLPSLGEMQQQLGEQIKELGEKQQSGRQLSEELARLAAEQEMIRQQLQQLQEKLDGQMGNEKIGDNLNKAIKMMEDNEVDLVNKNISRQLIQRQKEITTRMLEAEEALREQEKDPEREGKTAQQRNRIFPPSFEEYLRERKKEIELLRSTPVELKPFYKKEVNEYFRRLSESN